MTNTIIDSADICEIDDINVPEDGDFSDLTATHEPEPETMNFHVQMRGYTMRDFETLVIHAAAQQLIGGRTFKSEIEAKVAQIAGEKVNAQLSDAMRDIMGFTVQKRGAEAVTLGQMIGMEGKDYLTQAVDSSGNPVTDSWGRSIAKTRVAWLVEKYVHEHFAKEIKTAMDAMLVEVRAEVTRHMKACIEAERARVMKALNHEVEARR